MRRSAFYVAIVFLSLLPAASQGELFLTAEVTPTIGLPGFETYRITATSDLGNIVGFDFSEIGSFGIFGDINQVNPAGQPTIFPNSNVLFGLSDPSQDSQFLLNADEVVSLFTSESNSSLHGVFAVAGEKQQTIGNSVPFVQITTAAASTVSLKGMLGILRPNNTYIDSNINVALADIPIGPEPRLGVLPIPEPTPIPTPIPAPVLPPAPVQPPLPGPVLPPVQLPDPILPPGPVNLPPGPGQTFEPGTDQLFLTAEVAPTIGLAGFQTYRITATSNLGNVVGFDFSEVGSYGVLGPLNQVHPADQQTIFSNSNSLIGSHDPSQDTQFLFDTNDVVALFTDESETALHGVFAVAGEKQETIGNSVPFLQITTSDASAVSLKGALAILRAGQMLGANFDMSLSDIPMGPAPIVEILPMPEPIPEPVLPPAPVVDPTPAPIVDPIPGPVIPPQTDPGAVVGEPPLENPPDPGAIFARPPLIDRGQWEEYLAEIGVPILQPGFHVIDPIEFVWVGTTIDNGIWMSYLCDASLDGFDLAAAIDFTTPSDIDVSGYSVPAIVTGAGQYTEDTNSLTSIAHARSNSWATSYTRYVATNDGAASSSLVAASETPEPSTALLLALSSLVVWPLGRRYSARSR